METIPGIKAISVSVGWNYCGLVGDREGLALAELVEVQKVYCAAGLAFFFANINHAMRPGCRFSQSNPFKDV